MEVTQSRPPASAALATEPGAWHWEAAVETDLGLVSPVAASAVPASTTPAL